MSGKKQDPITVMLFVPDKGISEFWQSSLSFAKAVARDLNINLNPVFLDDSARNRFGFQRLIQKKLNESEKPDFILTILYGGGEYVQLNTFNNMAVPFITFNSSIGPFELKVVKKPRQHFSYWKGHLSPDEFSAGANLVSDLVASKEGSTLAILGGATSSVVNTHRIEGAITQAKKLSISVLAPVFTDWSTENAKWATRILLQRAPEIDMIWTAGPELAVGASEALKEFNQTAVIGSFDWTETTIGQIRKNELLVSYGGHFTEAGWALILLYDYLHGFDYAPELGTIILSQLQRLDGSNQANIASLIQQKLWPNIDFKQFTKCLNPQREKYDFSLAIQ